MSEEGPKQDAECITTTETPTSHLPIPVMSDEGSKQDAESTTTTETPISTAAIHPETSDGIANESSVLSTIPPEDVPAVLCCACCATCTLFVVCLPCEIVGFIVRCLLFPFKCAILCCCPPAEKPPVPESESTA